jgi:hypothetical protein
MLLRENHPGISRKKALARSIIWFLTLDQQIEQLMRFTHTQKSGSAAKEIIPFEDKPLVYLIISHQIFKHTSGKATKEIISFKADPLSWLRL